MTKFIRIDEFLFTGRANLLFSRPDTPYLVYETTQAAANSRGIKSIMYRDELIAQEHIRKYPKKKGEAFTDYMLKGNNKPSREMLKEVEKYLMRPQRLSDLIRQYE